MAEIVRKRPVEQELATNAPDIDPETGLEILVPGQIQGGKRPAVNREEARQRANAHLATRAQQPQPLATRHLDPRYNPAVAVSTELGPRVPKKRYKVREGFMFYYGIDKKEGFKGPCIVHLTDDETEGQLHKLELLGDKPVQLAAATRPVALQEDMSARDRAERIAALKNELQTLEAEHEAYLEGLKAKSEKNKDTLREPEMNPQAESPALQEEPVPAETSGTVQGPAFNPDAADAVEEPKNKGGRPAGKTSKVKNITK
jgi:hypothetical protein